MARIAKQLGVTELAKITKPGRYAIGRQTYMELTRAGNRHWLVRYSRNGKPTWQALGRVDIARWPQSLQDARQRAADVLEALTRGDDPIEAGRSKANPVGRVTFGDVLGEYIEAHRKRWTNDDYAEQVERLLRDYTAPIARRPVADIEVKEIKAILAPHWHRTPATCQRTRAHIAGVFSLAASDGRRVAINPAALDVIGPAFGGTVQQEDDRHHPAMPWRELPSLYARLAAIESDAAYCLRFLILTAARTAEARDVPWGELDTERKLWTVPGKRMKKRRAHRVPLSAPALEILDGGPRGAGADLVFNVAKNEMYELMRGLTGGAYSVHGLRSSFADWAADCGICSDKVADAALAHRIKNKTTRAYLRTDYFDERVKVMADWAFFLATC